MVTALPHDMMAARGPYEVRHGDVWNGDRHIADGSGLLAAAIDGEGIIHKHGDADSVSAWRSKAQTLIGDIEVVSFPVTPETVALLNWSAARSGSGNHFKERLELISAHYGHDHPSLAYHRAGLN